MRKNSLPLGRTLTTATQTGFTKNTQTNPVGTLLSYEGDGHIMTVAPTGAGKGVSCVIPALVAHQGSAIVLDPKGENYIITHQRREDLGQNVVCLDPFETLKPFANTAQTHHQGFNPFDLLPYLSSDRTTACRMLAESLLRHDGMRTDPFWRDSAVNILAGLIDVYDKTTGITRSLGSLVRDLNTEVPDAKILGIVPKEDILQALINQDPDLAQTLETLDISAKTLRDLYTRAKSKHRFATQQYTQDIDENLARLLKKSIKKARKKPNKSAQDIIDDLLFTQQRPVSLEMEFWHDLSVMAGGLLQEKELAYLYQITEDPDSPYRQALSLARMESITKVVLEDPLPLALHVAATASGNLAAQTTAIALAAPDRTWGSILTTLRSGLSEYAGDQMARFLQGGFSMQDLVDGPPTTVYLAFPPAKIRAHPMLFRCLIEGAINALLTRTTRPELPTLFLLDEVAQLGHMEFLITSKTLLRGYGVQVWTFWQDFAQLQTAYPAEWPTLVNNSRVIQLFGRNMSGPPARINETLDFAPTDLMTLDAEHMLLWMDSPKAQRVQRLVSYRDPDISVHCAQGPFVPANHRANTPTPPAHTPLKEANVIPILLPVEQEPTKTSEPPVKE